MNFFNVENTNIQEHLSIEKANNLFTNFEYGILSSIILGVKSSILIFIFI